MREQLVGDDASTFLVDQVEVLIDGGPVAVADLSPSQIAAATPETMIRVSMSDRLQKLQRQLEQSGLLTYPRAHPSAGQAENRRLRRQRGRPT